MSRSTLLIVGTMIASIAILFSLGTWQMARLDWKEQLITQTNERVASKPRSLEQVESLWSQKNDVDYMPVELSGTFDHQREVYYYNTWKGKTGWDVITPFILADDRIVLLNRGFVPNVFKNQDSRKSGLISGNVHIVGLARNPVLEKPNSLIPDNQLPQREFFWKSFPQISRLAQRDTADQVLPFLIDQGKTERKGVYPISGTTRIQFTNNHLQYAVTWYGLGVALFIIGSLFLYSRRNSLLDT